MVQSFRWFNGFCNYIIPQKEELGTTFLVCEALFFYSGAATAPFLLFTILYVFYTVTKLSRGILLLIILPTLFFNSLTSAEPVAYSAEFLSVVPAAAPAVVSVVEGSVAAAYFESAVVLVGSVADSAVLVAENNSS